MTRTHATKVWHFPKSLSADEQTRLINSFKVKYTKHIYKTHVDVIGGEGETMIRIQLEFEPTEEYNDRA